MAVCLALIVSVSCYRLVDDDASGGSGSLLINGERERHEESARASGERHEHQWIERELRALEHCVIGVLASRACRIETRVGNEADPVWTGAVADQMNCAYHERIGCRAQRRLHNVQEHKVDDHPRNVRGDSCQRIENKRQVDATPVEHNQIDEQKECVRVEADR